MKLKDIKAGMKLKAVGDYGGCICKGDQFVVLADEGHDLYICCRGPDGMEPLGQGRHDLASTATGGDIPELEPA